MWSPSTPSGFRLPCSRSRCRVPFIQCRPRSWAVACAQAAESAAMVLRRSPSSPEDPCVSGHLHFRPRSSRPMLVHAGDRGTGRHIPVDLSPGIRLGLESDQGRVPDPVLAAASVTLADRLPRPELRWQITPRAPCPKTVDRPLNQRAVRPHRPTHRPLHRRQRRSIRAHISSENSGT